MSSHLRLVAGVFAALLFLGACGGGSGEADGSSAQEDSASEGGGSGDTGGECGGSGGETLTLEATNFQYEPTELTAPAGEQVTVEFTNNDDVPHTFTVSDLECDTGSIAGGKRGQLSFTMPDGETEFICLIHPDMTGTLAPE